MSNPELTTIDSSTLVTATGGNAWPGPGDLDRSGRPKPTGRWGRILGDQNKPVGGGGPVLGPQAPRTPGDWLK